MKTNNSELENYVRKCLSLGDVKVVASELRRGLRTGWIPVEDLHADELARMRRITDVLSEKNEYLRIGIDPDTGVIASLMVTDRNLLIDSSQPDSLPLDNGKLEEKDESFSKRFHANASAAQKVAAALKAGTIKTLEDLSKFIPSKADEDAVKEILGSARENAIDLETQAGRVRLGGVENLTPSLPSGQSHIVRAQIRSIDDDAGKTGAVGIKISHVQSTLESLHMLVKGRRCTANLRTVNNTRTLRVLDFARYHGAEPMLELQLCYHIKSRRLEIEITAILDEDSLLKLDRPVQARLADF